MALYISGYIVVAGFEIVGECIARLEDKGYVRLESPFWCPLLLFRSVSKSLYRIDNCTCGLELHYQYHVILMS